MRKKLEFQADRIEAVLSLHKIPARVTGGTVTPRWVRFQVLPAIGAKIARIKGLSEELAAALDARNCRVSRRGAAVDVEIPRDDPQPVRLLPLLRELDRDSPVPPITATLGIAEDGTPLLIRLPSPDVAHILVAGTTGSGKTMLLKSMILSLALSNPAPRPDRHRPGETLSLILVDPKGHTFAPFERLPHLARPIIREVGETTEALQSLVRLMDRYEQGSKQPHVVLVIDELADILMTGGKPIEQALARLTQRGREANIHVVAATQKPSNDILGPLIKSNFPARIVGMVTSASDARTATGWTGTGAERLLGKGDFLAVAEGQLIRFQATHVSRKEIEKAVAEISPSSSPARQIALPWPMRKLAGVTES